MNLAPDRKVAFLAVVVFLLGVFLSGCARYRVGSTLPAHLKTVHVVTFGNSSPEPGIETDVTNEVTARFRIDGNLRPVSLEKADAVLEGEIVGWRRAVVLYAGEDKDEVEEYRLYVTAVITLFDRRREQALVSARRVTGETTFVVAGALYDSELAARPAAFRELARRVVDEVTAYW